LTAITQNLNINTSREILQYICDWAMYVQRT